MDAIQTAIQGFILDLFGGWFLAEEFCVLICSMLPIIELRGAIPMAAAFGMPWWLAYTLSIIGNILPVPREICDADRRGDNRPRSARA